MIAVNSPGPRRIDEIGEESRRRILDAAEELFAERGFDRTSFVDIAKRSGISRGSIPWHFKNKDGLVMAVVERAVDRIWPAERYESVPSLSEVFRETAELLRSGNSALVFMILVEALGDRGVVHDQYREFFARRREGIEVLLRLRRPADADPETAAEQERTALHPRLGLPMRAVDHAFFVAEHDDHHLARITELLRAEGGGSTPAD